MTHEITRRRMLRSTMMGAGVTLCLPILDMALDINGVAFAATGKKLPVRFGTWHWGCGMNPDRWVPKTTGAKWEVTPELAPLAKFREEFNLYTGYKVLLDGRPNEPHISAVWALKTGYAPTKREDIPDPSFDHLIARAIGNGTRFRSIDMAATGGKTDSYSSPGGNAINSPELSATALYRRIFGGSFQDPNSATFTPDPDVMLRRSVLSGFTEERTKLMNEVGSSDRQKLDAYFTSVRELEQKLSLELEKPAPADACVVPKAGPAELVASSEIEGVIANHKLMTDLIVLAMQCHQTNVFNMVFSPSASTLRRAGSGDTHHMQTHVEAVDGALGYQKDSTWYSQQSIHALAYFIEKLSAAQEGGRPLLDNLLVYAHSDTSDAKLHSLEELPVLTIGRAGGRMKTGLHVRDEGALVTQTALTVMQALGMGTSTFGRDSMATTKVASAALV